MKNLVVETNFPELRLEEASGRPLTISGIASIADEVNGNSRIYPLSTMSREVSRMNEDLASSNRVGTVDHPYGAPSVADLALKFTRVWMEGKAVNFEAEVIPTAKGRDLEAIIRAGVRVGISSRGYASQKIETRNGRQVAVIQDDFELESFDCVVTPSVANARITQYEQLIEALRAERPEIYAALERLANDAGTRTSVQGSTDGAPKEADSMTLTDAELIRRAHEASQRLDQGQSPSPEAAPAAEQEPETTVAEETAPVESGDVVAEETVAEADAEETPEVAAEGEETVEEPATEEVEAEPTAEAAEPVAAGDEVAQALTREAQATLARERAEARVAELEAEVARLNEDANIRAALNSLVVAINDHVGQGNFDTVASIARCASSLDFIDRYMAGDGSGMYDALKGDAGQALADAVLAPLGALAGRIERDAAAEAATEGERYGRRIAGLLREECADAEAVKERFAEIRDRVLREAGVAPAPLGPKGRLKKEELDGLTEEQLEQRRLAGIK